MGSPATISTRDWADVCPTFRLNARVYPPTRDILRAPGLNCMSATSDASCAFACTRSCRSWSHFLA
eukprot:1230240-Alexandrium_andersonii.AAC.1